jgi:type IV secretory pathway TraG/TraD family ATPase VirD4
VQSLASLELVYGRTRAQVLRDSVETQFYFRPTDETTATYLSNRLGRRSDYAHSSTSRGEGSESKGLSEQGVPLMTAQEIMRLPDTTLLAFHRDKWPMRLTRLEWYHHPILVKRRSLLPPALKRLPPLDLPDRQADQVSNGHNQRTHDASTNTLWQRHRKLPKGYIDPDKRY